ncbi:unnamed protein product [Calypogeia fissa]
MGSYRCCCSQNIGVFGDSSVDQFSSSSCRRDAGRGDFRSNFRGNFAEERNAPAPAGTSCANTGDKCGVIRCHSGISVINQQGCSNASVAGGGGLQSRRGSEALVSGIGMEGSHSQEVRQRSEKIRTHSVGLLPLYSILESSSYNGCTASKAPSRFSVAAISSSSNGDNNDKKMNTKSSRMMLSTRMLAIVACFGGIGGVITVLLSTLPPDFKSRWRMLLHDSPQGEGPSQGGHQSPTLLYDRHGIVIATIAPGGYTYNQDDALPQRSGKSGNTRALPAEIPSWLWQAVVAAEDRRFFKHQGVDPRGLSRAVLSLATRGGGSTVTQQLIKNVFLTNERKWTRKFLEIILALVLEKQMSKWDILHCYLKKIYWGHGVYGIEGASALYFGKHPSLLTLGECAMLVGIIPAPELLTPYRDPSRGKKPQGRVLRRMVESGFLDTASAVEALREPLKLASESIEGISGSWKAPYFVSEVLFELTEKYGWSKVAYGGLQVHTTLDLSMQTVAEKVILVHVDDYDKVRILLADDGLQKTQERLEALQIERQEQVAEGIIRATESTEDQSGHFVKRSKRKKLRTEAADYERREEYLQATMSKYQEEIKAAEKSRMEAAMVAVDPLDGAVRVLVGGRDYYESSFNWGTQAFRSAGSTLEPVVYLTALAEGLKRDHVLMNEPLTTGGISPDCYDRKFRGKVTLEEALVYSLKVPTVRLCSEVGVDKVREMGRALGIETFLSDELTLSLGGCEVTPMQLASAYATIAAGGVYHKPHLITRIESHEGHILEEHQPSKHEQQLPVVNQRAISELCKLLQAVVDKGTGQAAQLGRPCAGMTGTSDEHEDVWFAGFTPEISCVVWLGYDDHAPVGGLHPATGASHAAPLWKEFMTIVHEGVPVREFHERGSKKYGNRAPKPIRRARCMTRIGLSTGLKKRLKKKEKIPWKQIWNWEEASAAWKEKEKMDDWVSHRMRKATTTHWQGLS